MNLIRSFRNAVQARLSPTSGAALSQPAMNVAMLGVVTMMVLVANAARAFAIPAAGDFGFDVLATHRVFAQHLDGNDRSGALLRAIGMRFEGVRRGHVRQGLRFRDLHGYAITRDDRAG